jgi:hypothetical protein
MTNIIQKITGFLFGVKTVRAEDTGGLSSSLFNIRSPIGSGNTSIESIINSIIDFMVIVGLPLAGLMYLWAGFQFLTAGGNSKKVDGAKKTILYTTIGVAILLTAKGIIIVVQGILAPSTS